MSDQLEGRAPVVGCFEEEAVIGYALDFKLVDRGRAPNVLSPAIARLY